MDDRMFDPSSFEDLQDASEVKAAVAYLAHNEAKFKRELASEGKTYEEIQEECRQLWTSLLKLCSRYKYSDYIVEAKKQIYSGKSA